MYNKETILILKFIFLLVISTVKDIEKTKREVKMLAVSNCTGH